MTHCDGNFSAFITKTLNAMGYEWDTIKQRRDIVKQTEHVQNNLYLSKFGMSVIGAGSQREGVCAPYGGDNDAMLILHEAVAVTNIDSFERQQNLTLLKLDLDQCPPGYAQLSLARHGGRLCYPVLRHDLAKMWSNHLFGNNLSTSYTGQSYLSSEKFINSLSKLMEHGMAKCQELLPDSLTANYISFSSRSGPSLPSCHDNNFCQTHVDNVFAITCHCPEVFETFRKRTRFHGWPPENVIREIAQFEAHVVPVGHKKSPSKFIEWRICFTKAEIRLIECLTEPQIHVYVLLKIFAKDVLKKTWDALTSYLMKNLILWMAELIPGHKFRADTVVDRFLDCLHFLRRCVKSGYMPNYMISERNLLSHTTFVAKRRILIRVLDECLQEKGSCLLKSDIIKEAMLKMHSAPEDMIKSGLDRDHTEAAMMSFWTRVVPEYNMTTSPHDMIRLGFAGYMNDILRLFFERYTPEEIMSDPLGTVQRMFQTTLSHLK